MSGRVVLQTDRLILRKFAEADVAAFLAMGTDPDLIRYTHDSPLRDAAHALEVMRKHPLTDYRRFGFGRLACVLKQTGEVIGFSGLKWLPERGEVDLGYRFLRSHWGVGLATEAGRASLQYGFTRLGLKRIIGLVDPANVASVRVLQKLGMTHAGTAQCGELCAERYVIDRSGDDVWVERVEARPLAVVRRHATRAELPTVIPEALGEVWAVVRARGISAGRNVAVYLDGPSQLECGVEVAEPFAGDGPVFASATPAGLAATAVHVGPYGRLHEGYAALHRWREERGQTFAEPFWEVYGHHCEDEAHLTTEVRYLLREGGDADRSVGVA